MSDVLDEALAALREDAPLGGDTEETLARIQRSIAGEQADSGERLLQAAAMALRAQSDDLTLARIQRTIAASAGDELEDDELLDVAASMLRAESSGERRADATLARIHERVAERATRETENRVLATLGAKRTRARWASAAAAILALMIGAPTTWALASGALQRWLEERGESPPRSQPRAVAAQPVPRAEPIAAPRRHETPLVEAPQLRMDDAQPEVDEAQSEVEVVSPRRRPRRARPAELDLEPSAEARERVLFQAAHRQHFGSASHDQTLAAWDTYLAAHPSGRYVPEARYNRAITLIRLGRRTEGRRALASFADAPEGSYRRHEARALIQALDAQ